MTDKSLNILAGYQRAIESMVVVSVGTLMHLNSISIIELRHSKLPLLMPNAASTLFAFSILCIFANLRSLWRPLRNPQRIFSFLMEMTLILYGTDFVVRQLWLPSLKVLSFLCNLLTHYTVNVNKKFLTHQAPFIDDWMRTEAFYLVRFIWALVVFIFMLDTTGVIETLQENLIKKKIKWCIDDDINFDDNLSVGETALEENLSKDDISSQSSYGENAGTNSVPFDFNELPYVAQEDIASSAHAAAGVRRRRKMSRKTKRNNKVSLNNTVKECFC